jgi:hypothetical protein
MAVTATISPRRDRGRLPSLTPSTAGPTIAEADARLRAVERREGEALPVTSPPLRALLVAAGAAFVAACGGSPVRPLRPEYDLRAPDPELRTRAVARVGATRDMTHVPTLIYLLDDDDAAVRAVAGATLLDLTGHDTGYRPYLEPVERRRHQEAWRIWWSLSGAGAPAKAPGDGAPPAGGGGADGRQP